jgi:uncharacterized protein YnzC (UPF0291/DUF896 family)
MYKEGYLADGMSAIKGDVTFDAWFLENEEKFAKLSAFEKEDIRAYFSVYSLFYISVKNTIKVISNLDAETNDVLLLNLCHNMALLYKNDIPRDIDKCSKIFVTCQANIVEALQAEART